jgi:hypothetical protein
VFVPGKLFQPSLIFADKARVYLSEAHFRCYNLGVAHARFFLLKLPNCGLLLFICLSRLGVPRPRIEPLQAIGTIRALPRPPSTRLGCHNCKYYIFVRTKFSFVRT